MLGNDNQFICLLILIVVIGFLYSKGRASRPLNFDTFFRLDSSIP